MIHREKEKARESGRESERKREIVSNFKGKLPFNALLNTYYHFLYDNHRLSLHFIDTFSQCRRTDYTRVSLFYVFFAIHSLCIDMALSIVIPVETIFQIDSTGFWSSVYYNDFITVWDVI